MTKRACDACSVRKIRCNSAKPCLHCVQNNLKCTVLRERRKSGPKNLQRKTLDTIDSMMGSHPNGAQIKPSDIVDILKLLENVQLAEIIELFTVALVISESEELIRSVTEPSTTSLNIRRRVIAYSLCLCILEVVFKMATLPGQSPFFVFPVSYYRALQPDLFAKTHRLLLTLESDLRMTDGSPDPSMLYDNALACSHVYMYHRLAPSSPRSRTARFIHLRHAVLCLQLLEAEAIEQLEFPYGQIYELYEFLYILERLNYYMLDKGGISPPVLRDNLNMEASKLLDLKNQLFALIKSLEPNLAIFRYLNFNQILAGTFSVADFKHYCAQSNVTPELLKQLLLQLEVCELKSDTVYLLYMLIFNTLTAFKVELAQSILTTGLLAASPKTLQLLGRINVIFQGTDLAILAIRAVHGQFIPQFLVMLQQCIIYAQHPLDRKVLEEYTENIFSISQDGYLLDPYIRLLVVLQDWFLQRSSKGKEGDSRGTSTAPTSVSLGPPTVVPSYMNSQQPIKEGVDDQFVGIFDEVVMKGNGEEMVRRDSISDLFLYYQPERIEQVIGDV